MIEQIATIVITLGSAAMFAYWFRYSCALILNARTTRDFAASVVAAKQLGFQTVQARLREAVPADLGGLHAMLDRDYAVLNTMMEGAMGIEDRLLKANYRLLGVWSRVSQPFSAAAAKKALDEMSQVVAHFANSVGERAACAA
jgi:hypothetical protein